MNPTKTKYARERAEKICKVHIGRIAQEKKYDNIQENIPYTKDTHTIKQLRKDVVNIIENEMNMEDYIQTWTFKTRHVYGSGEVQQEGKNFEDCIKELLDKSTMSDDERARRKALREELKARQKAIRTAHDKCMDLVVLGDEAMALEELEKFASTEF